ncbi:MAG: hypothetical protein AAF429_01155 [Pseudomonadota bacterium]
MGAAPSVVFADIQIWDAEIVLTRFYFAALRAAFVAFVILLVSSDVENLGTAEGDLFVIFLALIAFIIVVFEYAAKIPVVLEFRYARPYNMFRAAIALVIIATLMGFSEIPRPLFPDRSIFGDFVALLSGPPFPGYFILRALDYDPQAGSFWLYENTIPASLFGFAVALFGGIWLWVSNWPLGREGFDLWKNMPNFHPTSGKRATELLLRSVIFQALTILMFPYLFAYLLGFLSNVLGFNFQQSPVFSFWLIFTGLLIPILLFFKSIAFLKLCLLAENLRKSDP